MIHSANLYFVPALVLCLDMAIPLMSGDRVGGATTLAARFLRSVLLAGVREAGVALRRAASIFWGGRQLQRQLQCLQGLYVGPWK